MAFCYSQKTVILWLLVHNPGGQEVCLEYPLFEAQLCQVLGV